MAEKLGKLWGNCFPQIDFTQYKKEYLPALKEEKEYLKDTDKFVYENACHNVDDAYNRFFKGLSGFPKYASRTKPNGNSYTTNFTNNNIELKMIDGIPYVKLPKIGNVRFILPRGKTLIDIQPQEVSIKGATVSREPDGSYRISLRMESVIDKPVHPSSSLLYIHSYDTHNPYCSGSKTRQPFHKDLTGCCCRIRRISVWKMV